MTISPGHLQWPKHKITEKHPDIRYQIFVDNIKIVDSIDVIKVAEDNHPDRYYIPRVDVKMELLTPSSTTSECPFKGHANYFSLKTDNKKIQDLAWTYESPYDEHTDLRNRLAFYEDKVDEVRIFDANGERLAS